jgi:GPH family glycoside/pentoside/hexuronide:cation symporter
VPYVLFGTPVMVMFFLGLFFPPLGPERPLAVALYLVTTNVLFWCAFSAVVAPYLALLPEIARGPELRTRISTWMTAFQVLVTISVNLALGRVVAAMHGGGDVLGIRFENGFEPQALVAGALSITFLWAAIASVRERPAEENAPPHLDFRSAITESLRNPAFLPLVVPLAVFLIGTNVMITAVPYMSRALLHATEAEASLGVAMVYGAALLGLPLVVRLVPRVGKKRVYAGALLGLGAGFCAMPLVAVSPWPTPTYLGIMALLGLPVGALMVLARVLISDVADHDEERTGLRREAMYFGMQGLLTKVSFGLGPLLATQLFALFGNTAERPLGVLLCGPVAGVLAFAGWRVFRRYPLD